MPTAKDLMTADPITLKATAKVSDALQILQSMEIRHLPVINAQQELIGVVSDRDLRNLSILRSMEDTGVSELRVALAQPISAVMTGDVISVEEEDDAAEVIDLMLEHKIGAVPVVDAEGSLVGIVSYIDVLRELAELLEDAAQ